MSRTLQVRLSDEAYTQLEEHAREAGVSLSDWARARLLEEPQQDGRARRWAELRARLRPILQQQPDDAIWLLTQDVGAGARVGALALVARLLGLDRALTAQEAGIVADVAHAEAALRAEEAGPSEG